MSDRPIAERVSYFACPSNAVEEIRAMAAYTSPYPEARGVADILARLPA
jgi:hydroxymethylpyrimidine pyrophosphatase-like HAD family hydrolase